MCIRDRRKHARMVEAPDHVRWLFGSDGKYLLHMPEKEVEFVRVLVAGAGVAALDFQDPQAQGRTALLRALTAKHIGLFQALLDAGADPLLGDERGRDCLFLAAENPVIFARAHSSITLSADGTEATDDDWKNFNTAVSGAVMRSGRHYAEFTRDDWQDGDPMIGVIGPGFDVENGDDAYCHEGCLLYTSPSPRDATLSRMPSSA